jgi:hypothetical protein
MFRLRLIGSPEKTERRIFVAFSICFPNSFRVISFAFVGRTNTTAGLIHAAIENCQLNFSTGAIKNIYTLLRDKTRKGLNGKQKATVRFPSNRRE